MAQQLDGQLRVLEKEALVMLAYYASAHLKADPLWSKDSKMGREIVRVLDTHFGFGMWEEEDDGARAHGTTFQRAELYERFRTIVHHRPQYRRLVELIRPRPVKPKNLTKTFDFR